MTNQTQNRQVKQNTAEKEFFQNIIIPDVAVLIIGLTASFGTILNFFA